MSNQIPRKLHFIWIGDETKTPIGCIQSWKEKNPSCEIKVWGNKEYHNRPWINFKHMQDFWRDDKLCGVADLMRWEILMDEGGVAIDADSLCLRPLENYFFECDFFACYENEIVKPGIISNGLVGAHKDNSVIKHIVEKVNKEKNIARKFIWYRLKTKKRPAWKTVGPIALTNAILETGYLNATIFPSHFFVPNHYSGSSYTGSGPVYCDQLWGSTKVTEPQSRQT